jgi:hypothetical protein
MAKRKCSINDNIKSEYPFIKAVNENAECTLCNAKFCITRGQLDVVNHHTIKCTEKQEPTIIEVKNEISKLLDKLNSRKTDFLQLL